jgi:hypothetical protein
MTDGIQARTTATKPTRTPTLTSTTLLSASTLRVPRPSTTSTHPSPSIPRITERSQRARGRSLGTSSGATLRRSTRFLLRRSLSRLLCWSLVLCCVGPSSSPSCTLGIEFSDVQTELEWQRRGGWPGHQGERSLAQGSLDHYQMERGERLYSSRGLRGEPTEAGRVVGRPTPDSSPAVDERAYPRRVEEDGGVALGGQGEIDWCVEVSASCFCSAL